MTVTKDSFVRYYFTSKKMLGIEQGSGKVGEPACSSGVAL